MGIVWAKRVGPTQATAANRAGFNIMEKAKLPHTTRLPDCKSDSNQLNLSLWIHKRKSFAAIFLFQ